MLLETAQLQASEVLTGDGNTENRSGEVGPIWKIGTGPFKNGYPFFLGLFPLLLLQRVFPAGENPTQ